MAYIGVSTMRGFQASARGLRIYPQWKTSDQCIFFFFFGSINFSLPSPKKNKSYENSTYKRGDSCDGLTAVATENQNVMCVASFLSCPSQGVKKNSLRKYQPGNIGKTEPLTPFGSVLGPALPSVMKNSKCHGQYPALERNLRALPNFSWQNKACHAT